MATDSKIFIDTAPFIYYIEKDNLEYFEKVKNFFAMCYETNKQLVTSAITEEEYFVLPFRTGNSILIETFKALTNILNIDVQVIDEEIAELAAKIRAEYKFFKSMDALQLACAVKNNCEYFLTNDKQLLQFKEMNILLLDELQ